MIRKVVCRAGGFFAFVPDLSPNCRRNLLSRMEILTKRLLLREYRLDDWEAVHLYNSDADALKYEAWGPNSVIQTKAFVQACLDHAAEKRRTRVELVVCLQQTGQLIGGCGLLLGERRKGVATMGYTFNRDFWGNGYATEAAMAMVELSRSIMGIHTVFATCNSENIASQKVLQKCGLQPVGMLAELEMVKGKFRDMIHYELFL